MEDIRLKLSADHAQMAADMKKAKDAVQANASGMSAAMGRVKDSFNNGMKALLGFRSAMIVLAGAAGLAALIKKSIDTADELSKMAQKVGVTTETLSTLKYAADLADVSLESVGTGLKKLSKNAADASNGTGEARYAFKAIGIELKNSEGQFKKTDELLYEIADVFKRLPDGAEKTALAMNLFGRSGAELIPLLNEGAAGIQDLQARARELGLELSTQAGKSAEEFNDRLTDLKAEAEGLGRSIAVNMLPGLNEYVKVVRLAYDDTGLLMAAWVALGGVGEAVFTSSLERRIKKLKEAIEFPATDTFTGLREDVEALKAELAKLEAIKAQNDAENKRRSEERRQQEEDEVKLKEKFASALRKTMEAQRDAEKQAQEMAKTQEKALAKEGELMEEADKIAKEYFDNMKKEIKEFYDDTRTPLEKYQDTIKKLNDLHERGMDEHLYWRSVAKAMEDLEKATKKPKDEFEDLKRTIEGWGKDSANAILEFTKTGKMSFSGMVDSIINDLLRMMIYQKMTKPLFGEIAGIDWSNLGGLFGMSGPGSVSAKGNVFDRGNVIPFSRGGLVTRPTVFPMAHGMGLMGEAGTEAVMPLARLPGGDLGVKAAGGGDVVVNIINKTGAAVNTKNKETQRGTELDVYIDNAVAKKISQYGSASNKALKQTYGARERLKSR